MPRHGLEMSADLIEPRRQQSHLMLTQLSQPLHRQPVLLKEPEHRRPAVMTREVIRRSPKARRPRRIFRAPCDSPNESLSRLRVPVAHRTLNLDTQIRLT